MPSKSLAAIIALALLAACDSGTTSKAEQPSSRIFDTQRKALENAKEVQQQLQSAQDTLQQAIEQQQKRPDEQ